MAELISFTVQSWINGKLDSTKNLMIESLCKSLENFAGIWHWV